MSSTLANEHMHKRFRIALAVLLVAILGVVARQVLAEREPVYQGKPLSVWLDHYITGGSIIDVQPSSEVDEAVRQICTNAIPTLLHMLKSQDSKSKLTLVRLSDRLGTDVVLRLLRRQALPAYYPTREAAVAFHALGASASNAVPRLIQTYREQIGLDSQCGCAEALGWIGPAAREAIPDLMKAATNADKTLRSVAVEALGNIHADPALVVPVLTKSLQDSSNPVRVCAIRSLAGFGSEAKPAVPALTQSLNDSSEWVRLAVTNALTAIDPEAAAKAGVE